MREQPPQKPKGLVLKEAREARGITLETVHAVTKIPLDTLKAIEEGYTVRSLSPFYLKGFMKMYAQYLGLDVREIVEDYTPEKLPKHPAKRTPTQFLQPAIQALDKKRQQQIVIALGILFLIFIIVKIASCGKKTSAMSATPSSVTAAKKETKKAVRTAKKKAQTAEVTSKSSEEKASSPAVQTPAGAAKTEKAGQKVRVTVKATAKVWLQVKVDGNLVLQSTLQEGAAESWQAEKEIELSGRNISFLEYEVNGKILGTLGRADRGARRVVITQDGLSVKQ